MTIINNKPSVGEMQFKHLLTAASFSRRQNECTGKPHCKHWNSPLHPAFNLHTQHVTQDNKEHFEQDVSPSKSTMQAGQTGLPVWQHLSDKHLF